MFEGPPSRRLVADTMCLSPEVGALHRVPSGEELRQPAEQRRLPVRRGRLRHGSGGEQGGGARGGD